MAGSELPELERRLKQGILDAIGPHIAKFVEEPLRARLDAHLQRTLTALSAQVKTDIETLIRDAVADRKSTRLNSSHQIISYAVFCLKKKKKKLKHKHIQ